MRRASRKDNTQAAVIEAFERAGWAVLDISNVGSGAPDLLVSKHGLTITIEVKTGKKQRRDNQIAWSKQWRGEYLWGNNPLYLLEQAEAILESRRKS